MGSIIGQKIDYNGVGALRGPAAHTHQTSTQAPPPGLAARLRVLARLALLAQIGQRLLAG